MEQGFARLEKLITALDGNMSLRLDKLEVELEEVKSTLDTIDKNTANIERRTTRNEDDIRQIKTKLNIA